MLELADDLPGTQLLVFTFASGASFDGGLFGAIERIETGMSLRVLDALCVLRNPETDELEILRSRGDGAGSMGMAVLDFRLDPTTRRAASDRALETEPDLAAFADALAPGAALIAVLIKHRWAEDLSDAVGRAGGGVAAVRFVDNSTLTNLVPELLALS